MKVIFGGAFNPVTDAHIKVYEYVMNRVQADEFIFLPVSSAYTKSDLASNYHRLNMLELAIKGKDNVRVSELEMNDSDFLGTYQSLIRFSDSEQVDVGFVIGADNLTGMHLWINIEGILSEFKIVVLSRYGMDIEKIINGNPILKKHKNSFIICDDFQVDISSTHFRENLNPEFVPKDVYKYVVENGLYQVDDDETEYKVGILSFFNHLPVLILEALFIYGSTFIAFYEWIWIAITSVILLATLVAISINSSKIYQLDTEKLVVRIGTKNIREYLLSNIKTIRKRKWNIDIGFKENGKVKTIYLGWYIRKYKKMRDQLFENIERLDNYDRIIFID